MATKTSEQTLQSLGVNLVASQTVFEQMQQASQIQPNEFYLIAGSEIADEALKLSNGRTLKVNLSSSSPSTAFDGTRNIHDIGVSGVLDAINGGTGIDASSLTKFRALYYDSIFKESPNIIINPSSTYQLETTGITESTVFSVDKKVELRYNTSTSALDFVFV